MNVFKSVGSCMNFEGVIYIPYKFIENECLNKIKEQKEKELKLHKIEKKFNLKRKKSTYISYCTRLAGSVGFAVNLLSFDSCHLVVLQLNVSFLTPHPSPLITHPSPLIPHPSPLIPHSSLMFPAPLISSREAELTPKEIAARVISSG